MIVADRKPLDEILEMVGDANRILVSACNTCVTVCLAGGRREAAILASQIRIHAQEAGRTVEVRENCLERHCDPEFLAELAGELEWADVMVSTACGVGVNLASGPTPRPASSPAEYELLRGDRRARALARDGVWRSSPPHGRDLPDRAMRQVDPEWALRREPGWQVRGRSRHAVRVAGDHRPARTPGALGRA